MVEEKEFRVDQLVRELNEDHSFEHGLYSISQHNEYYWIGDAVAYRPGAWQLFQNKDLMGTFIYNNVDDDLYPTVSNFYPSPDCPWKLIVSLREITGQEF